MPNLFEMTFQYALSITALNANWFYADIDGDQFRLLSKNFCLQRYFTKNSVSLVLAWFSGSVGWPHGKIFEILKIFEI